jgi:hypothetical protein
MIDLSPDGGTLSRVLRIRKVNLRAMTVCESLQNQWKHYQILVIVLPGLAAML